MGMSSSPLCTKCLRRVVIFPDGVTSCGCGEAVPQHVQNIKQERLRKVEVAMAKLCGAIEALEALVDSYPESEGPFSSMHPRSGYESMLKTLREQAKVLARGRV